MSHRISTTTQITNKDIASKALKAAGWKFDERGGSFVIKSGPMNGADINFKTGEVGGDSNYLDKGDDSLGALKRHYAEALFRSEAQKRGIDILSRTVDKNGEIVLRCKASFA